MQENKWEQIKNTLKSTENNNRITDEQVQNSKNILSEEQKQKLNQILSDRDALNALLSSPEAEIVKKMLKGKE